MKWQDLVDITPEQFMQMGKQELKEATQILASAGNKRLKRAQEKGFTSPSIETVLTKGKFSTKDKSFNELRNEFVRARNFLESKTGTLSEYNKFKRDTIKSLHEKSGIEISQSQFDNFWRAYEELKKNNPAIANKGLKYAVLEEINKLQKDNEELDVDTIVFALQGEVDRIYQESQEQQAQAEENASELGEWLDQLPEAPKTSDYNVFEDENRTRKAYEAYRKKARRRK